MVDAVRFCLFDDIAQVHSGQNFPWYRIMLTLLKAALTLIRWPLPSPLATAKYADKFASVQPSNGPRIGLYPLLFNFFQGRTGETGSHRTAHTATQSGLCGALASVGGRRGRRGPPVPYRYSFEDLLALLHGRAPAKFDAVALHRRCSSLSA